MKVEIIKCLKDNYSYILINEKNKNACVIDPSESEPIIDFVEKPLKPVSKSAIIGVYYFQKAEKLEDDMNSIFEFIEKLNELNTENVEPLTSIAETTLRFREDKITSDNIREKILKNSPEKNDDFFVVPKVVE